MGIKLYLTFLPFLLFQNVVLNSKETGCKETKNVTHKLSSKRKIIDPKIFTSTQVSLSIEMCTLCS